MRLDECMNSIAEASGIPNPMDGHMRRIFGRILTNMTDEFLYDMLNDYADLFKINLITIPLVDNMLIDYTTCISTFPVDSHLVTGQPKYQQRVFILNDVRQQLFAPLYVTHTDGSSKVCFDYKEGESICKEISDFIDKWNLQSKCIESNILLNLQVFLRMSKFNS